MKNHKKNKATRNTGQQSKTTTNHKTTSSAVYLNNKNLRTNKQKQGKRNPQQKSETAKQKQKQKRERWGGDNKTLINKYIKK